MNTERGNFLDLGLDELEQLFDNWGEPSFRASQVWGAVYKGLKTDPSKIPNIPKQLRAKLKDHFSFENLHAEMNLSSVGVMPSRSVTAAMSLVYTITYLSYKQLCISRAYAKSVASIYLSLLRLKFCST